ncbi:MAG: alcohol dehydrogenase, partial [Streptomyces sp.]|nr:alcohol dehydrogenase [Streptomyces sp.]
GSHGMAAHTYPGMLALVRAGVLRPDLLVTSTIDLDATPAALAAMGTAPGAGVTVIEPWGRGRPAPLPGRPTPVPVRP